MPRFGFTFDGPAVLEYNAGNVKKIENTLRALNCQIFSMERHKSGCIQLYVDLPSTQYMFWLEANLRQAGFRGPEGIAWAQKNPEKLRI